MFVLLGELQPLLAQAVRLEATFTHVQWTRYGFFHITDHEDLITNASEKELVTKDCQTLEGEVEMVREKAQAW